MSIEWWLVGLLTNVSTGICSGSDLSFKKTNKNWAILSLLIHKFKHIRVSILIDQFKFLFPQYYNSKFRISLEIKVEFYRLKIDICRLL